MNTSIGLPFVGLLAGVAVAAYLLSQESEDSNVSLFDYIGDIWVQMTTTEEGRIAELLPEVQEQFRYLLSDWSQAGIQVDVGSTFRTRAQEKKLTESGKTSKGLKVSWHELRRAIDVYPIDPETGFADRAGKNLELFRRMHAIAEARGWRNIAFNADGSRHYLTNANGDKVWDGAHIEWRDPYDTLAQAIKAEGATYGLA